MNADINVTSTSVNLCGDPARVVVRPFLPIGRERIRLVVGKVLQIPEEFVLERVSSILQDFSSRHRNLLPKLWDHFEQVARHIAITEPLSEERCLLIGAYCSRELAIESIALTNPSMLMHPDQEGLEEGEARFVVSLRASGESSLSTIEFREGVIGANGEVSLEECSPFAELGTPVEDSLYDKPTFVCKLTEMGSYTETAERILEGLNDPFTLQELRQAIVESRNDVDDAEESRQTQELLLWVAHSNHQLTFSPDTALSERVVFPVTRGDNRAIEDARFVRFEGSEGEPVYYGTYTTYYRGRALPQLLETQDFRSFRTSSLTGRCVQNVGMALFPRRIGDHYCMISRVDGENMYLMKSDNPYIWNEAQKIVTPRHPWNILRLGNCGSPVETEEGWLLLVHGVGPMRRTVLSVMLLDREDPTRVLSVLPQPLIAPADESHGIIPNTVYSCGMMRHGEHLVIPYGVCETTTSFATFHVNDVLERLRQVSKPDLAT